MNRSALKTAAAALTCLAPWAAGASEQPWSFEYNNATAGVLITGTLLGILQPDGNSIVVSAVQGVPSFNGAPAVALPFVDSLIDVVGDTSFLPPVVSLDGVRMDFAACSSAACNDGFGFEGSGIAGFPIVFTLSSFGNLNGVLYRPDDWSISAVPEPHTWLLMALGLAALAARRAQASAR